MKLTNSYNEFPVPVLNTDSTSADMGNLRCAKQTSL